MKSSSVAKVFLFFAQKTSSNYDLYNLTCLFVLICTGGYISKGLSETLPFSRKDVRKGLDSSSVFHVILLIAARTSITVFFFFVIQEFVFRFEDVQQLRIIVSQIKGNN